MTPTIALPDKLSKQHDDDTFDLPTLVWIHAAGEVVIALALVPGTTACPFCWHIEQTFDLRMLFAGEARSAPLPDTDLDSCCSWCSPKICRMKRAKAEEGSCICIQH
ncbi:hypothetical protein M378DRAFT_171150 [Amanita muscaria Koide BX008]|uniref:Uncharacterized protein n=1 Tax=Amanita muscaria (strain Koide BX008) TaxID=946122 RepID=A0A0C2S5G8_AMAMK|nr:hypothetical protein M378DRAFT_171150 [Amanita muscaria Koide BX008]